jgi:hypothetical protein
VSQTCEGPPRGGSADGPEVVCLAANSVEIAPKSCPGQTDILRSIGAVSGSVVSVAARHCRRGPVPSYDVRITVSSVRRPVGRTRPFHLAHADLHELIATAEKLEVAP